MTSDDPTSAPKAKSGELRQRVTSALVMIPLAIAAVWSGGLIFAAFVILLGVVMAWEWSRLVQGSPWTLAFACIAIGVVAAGGLMSFGLFFFALTALAIAWACSVIIDHLSGRGVFWSLFGVPYITLPVIALIGLRNDADYGLAGVIWVFAVVWSTDIFAYFAGRSIGGPKLAPRASPNKTWSGLLGGVTGAALAGIITAVMIGQTSVLTLAVISGALAVFAQIGDIAESAVKRHFGVKDSSHLIPGHGGIMDRLDGLVMVAVVAWLTGSAKLGAAKPAFGILVW